MVFQSNIPAWTLENVYFASHEWGCISPHGSFFFGFNYFVILPLAIKFFPSTSAVAGSADQTGTYQILYFYKGMTCSRLSIPLAAKAFASTWALLGVSKRRRFPILLHCLCPYCCLHPLNSIDFDIIALYVHPLPPSFEWDKLANYLKYLYCKQSKLIQESCFRTLIIVECGRVLSRQKWTESCISADKFGRKHPDQFACHLLYCR